MTSALLVNQPLLEVNPMLDAVLARAPRFSLVLALAAAVAAVGSGCAFEPDASEDVGETAQALTLTWPGHVGTGDGWVSAILPANNFYDSPPSIPYDANGVLHATAECASFTTQLLLQSYDGIITTDVLTALVGSASPFAHQYHDAIDPTQNHPNNPTNGVSLLPLDSARSTPTGRTLRNGTTTYLAVGDILASKYTNGSSTGHVMTVEFISPPPANQSLTLSDTHVIPGVTNVKRWTVTVLDSTSSVHGSSDTRSGKDATETDGNDHGIGRGTIYLYEDATTGSATLGQLVGWTWSTGSAYTYQFTNASGVDDKGKTTYRPMVIGRFSGGGL